MKINKRIVFLFLSFVFCSLFIISVFSQDELIPVIKFKDVDIKIVLQSIAQKATKDGKKVNIVTSPEVQGLVTVNLENVNWFTALDAVLRPYDYGYEWVGDNIILVDTLEKIQARNSQAKERQEVEPPRTRVFSLKYIDANDAKKAIEPLLSPIGRISVLEVTGQAGWEFGTDITKRSRSKEGKVSRTKTLIISDISKKLEEIEALLARIDISPRQIAIKTKVMEVNKDVLRDIGFDWGTGATGADNRDTFVFTPADKKNGIDIAEIAMHAVMPSSAGFGPKSTGLTDNSFKLIYKKLTGTQFEAILHALEEDGRVNTLSSPVILTLNNQEASILVGEKFPIIKTETSTETSRITGGSLDYYQDIGIQLNVVPQVCGENEDKSP
jgi:type II secretory pathway component GspD/PulD (secretin)